MLPLTGGLYLGWALGANDAANVFGTAVASRIITFRKACILCSVSIILGAMLQGGAGIHTLSGLTEQTTMTLLIISISAAFTVTLMTTMSLPISTSQAVVGAIAGIGLATNTMNWSGLTKIITCWVVTPVGAMFFSCIIYRLLAALIKYVPMSILTRDKILWSGLLIVGTYGSYALGANNVANATGIFSGQLAGISDSQLALFGGVAIAVGVLTYSKRVMMAVGSGIMPLDAFTAFTAVASMAVTVHIFAVIGVPVSTSQAIVGSIIGIGMIRGTHAIKFGVLRNIAMGWFLTPVISLILSAASYAVLVNAKF
ncbi:MAG: inorganic phosphate transporter family protein [Anaerohalosphaeraceae bacterium]|nr:inorganic phosphate transporter family protein [Anaerohalosphaeraceae bacterium]